MGKVRTGQGRVKEAGVEWRRQSARTVRQRRGFSATEVAELPEPLTELWEGDVLELAAPAADRVERAFGSAFPFASFNFARRWRNFATSIFVFNLSRNSALLVFSAALAD